MFLENVMVEMGLLWDKIASGSSRIRQIGISQNGEIFTLNAQLPFGCSDTTPVLSIRVPQFTTVTINASGACKAGYK